jgi:hypothetical protein
VCVHTHSRHAWIPGLARCTQLYSCVCVHTAVHVRKILVTHLILMKDYEGTAVPSGIGTAVHVQKILVRHLTLMKDKEGSFRD